MSATEASRSFAALLDGVEQGESVIVTRAGRRIAEIRPAGAGNGRVFADFLWSTGVDLEFASDVRAAREAVRLDEPAWPAD
ncbi:type II toxin-antitoxin system Phd/YefM family antitoxin [Agromyces archimandritae]|nr:type II toxin-antitoxin system prevent-host-death family antitoxin [Agromyces archimandritae]